jgi:hypothetical protein
LFSDHIDEFRTGRNDDLGILTQRFLDGFELSQKLCVSYEVQVRRLVDEPDGFGLALRRQNPGLLDPLGLLDFRPRAGRRIAAAIRR